MKRVASLVISGLLLSTTVVATSACKKKEEEVDIEAEIARNLEDAAANLRNHKADEAETLYKWVVEHDADNVDAHVGLAKVALEREDPKAAIEPGEKAVSANGEDAEARVALGRAYAGTEDWAKAAEHLAKAWELDDSKEQYGLEYGIAARESGDLEAAATVLKEVADLNPKLKYVYRELAKTHLAAEELDKALSTFMKAQSQWKGDQESYAGAAMVYEAKGEIPKAVDQWSYYIQQDCCSKYSKEVAQPKLAELKEQENADAPGAEEDEGEG